MKAVTCIFALALLAGLTACDSSPLLRDHYMGKRLAEPHLLAKPVPRDGQGQPRLHEEQDDRSLWQRLLGG